MGRVIQRLVPLGLSKGVPVIVIRSTSSEFHGAPAIICGPGEKKNEYLIEIGSTKEQVYARADQLKLTSDTTITPDPSKADLSAISGKPVSEILEMIRKLVKETINPKKNFVVGGSFAAFLHAVNAGQPARMPRDIDIILDKNDFNSSKPVKTNITFCGIPLELHQAGALITPTTEEIDLGIISSRTLLSKHMKKLRDQQFRFKEVVPKPESISAQELLKAMNAQNDRLMNMSDDKPDFMSDASKAVWMKALVDIETLAAIGATLH